MQTNNTEDTLLFKDIQILLLLIINKNIQRLISFQEIKFLKRIQDLFSKQLNDKENEQIKFVRQKNIKSIMINIIHFELSIVLNINNKI